MNGEQATSGSPRTIHVLTPDVTNKIAAGEVVERPASVVKELVENALDAGATRIQVEVKGGGKELIRVSDNGTGVPADQAALAFERHATSKIREAEDLTTVLSLGFRGEALPSIASISRVEFVTRPATQDEATRIDVADGRISQSVAGAPVGTRVSVYELFYNTPARYKFLKTDATERRYIAEALTNMALAHFGVSFTLVMEGREVLRTPGTGRLKECIGSVYGRSVVEKLVAVEWDSGLTTVSGYVGKPETAKGNRSAESIFVNGRWVQNRTLFTAVEKGYEALLAHRRFPLAVLHLSIDPTLIDVNVHPAKTEIRFKEEREVFKALMLSVRKALTEANLVREVGESGPPPPTIEERPAGPEATPGAQTRLVWNSSAVRPVPRGQDVAPNRPSEHPQWIGEARSEWSQGSTEVAATSAPAPWSTPQQESGRPAPAHEREDHARLALASERAERERIALTQEANAHGFDARELLASAQVLGQTLNTYLIVPVPHGLWLIDQHVAHERILYERVLNDDANQDRGRSRTFSQELLIPQTLSLTPTLSAALEEHVELLGSLGFAVEPFGPREWLMRSVPATLRTPGPTRLVALLEELITLFTEGGPTLKERAAAMVACRGAIKAGDVLQPEAMNHLVRELAHVANPFACPHGRPVILQLHQREIERRFGRT